ncbi:LacI family DNA-binding transcriptional regulator [Streptomyces sp. WMMC500]|uniref:LacI family DNA-binding transcriptional regulator n=1 Tax=Streptomyces sp. WMMC500 TaxID=3015154 RepID=UPI00248BA81B|nr:LacI family DNA-binding transcriptional regulator [Streptomyces sp. WMMC500]WBB59719.1 LacI family DNA-binding transcriptional regulator [Streptomyces sp. WMMC500]
MSGNRPTLEAVAARAGVSRATVSRVVNGGAGVRESLRERVHRAVAELGYVPNQAARTLVTRRTGAVAVVIAEPESRVFADPFFARQLRGISGALAAADTQLVLLYVADREDYPRIGRFLSGGHVDGALMFSLHRDDPLPGMAAAAGLPVVYGGRPGWPGAAGERGLLYVDTDNRAGAELAVRHLLERGRRRIGHIAGPLDQTSAVDRLAGYRAALAEGGGTGGGGTDDGATEGGPVRAGGGGPYDGGRHPELVAEGDFTPAGGERAMAELLARAPDLDAVFAASDLMATGALRTLRAHGRRVPADVAVVGYDDLEPATWTEPPLTTVHQDVEGMGGVMARMLLTNLGGGQGHQEPVVTTPRLVVRESG